MALTVEDGTGLSNADSYLSEADADAYHTAHDDPSAWSGASSADKENALRLATQYLDVLYGARWHGYRINSTMSLDWPRNSVVGRDGYTYLSTAVPQEVKDATAILALKVVNGDTLIPDVTAGANVMVESVSVGPISTSKTFSGEKTAGKQYSMVDLLLADLVAPSGSVWRA